MPQLVASHWGTLSGNPQVIEFVLIQSFCILAPAVVIAVFCFVLNCFLSKQKQISLRFDLLTLALLVTVAAIIVTLTKLVLLETEKSGEPRREPNFLIHFYTLLTIPLVLLIRSLIDSFWSARQQRAARKNRTLQSGEDLPTISK